MIMNVRLKVLKNKKPNQYALSNKYFNFLGKRTTLEEKERYKLTFVIYTFSHFKRRLISRCS